MSSTDYLRLNELTLFKQLRESIPPEVRKTVNILSVKSDVLFVWNIKDSCVLTLNLTASKSCEADHVCFQTLLPTCPPVFIVELLVVNESCQLCAVAGSKGLLLLKLPRREPPHGSFVDCKSLIYCLSTSLDERLYAYNKLVEVRQVKWHPGAAQDNVLVVLTSNNMFRFYTINCNLATEVKVYQIGTKPIGIPAGTTLSFLAGLGETGVDFDFGLPSQITETDAETKWEDLSWPIYILRGDGEIFILTTNINNKTNAILKGPLAMYPSDDDNYGEEACAILCFKTTPPVLAISTCTGTIYHGIVLTPNDDAEFGEKQSVIKHANYSIHPADKVVYVFETIELDLGLPSTDSDTAYSCPVFLHAAELNKTNYFCTHETGVHGITVPLISELVKILLAKEDSVDSLIANLNTSSSAEYILCSNVAAYSNLNPVLGFAEFYRPASVIILLASGQVITLPVSAYDEHIDHLEFSDSKHVLSPLENLLKKPFDMYIRKLLQPDVPQPIIKLSTNHKSTAEEGFEFLLRSIQTFREDYFKKFTKVYVEINKRRYGLEMLKFQQQQEIIKLNVLKRTVKENAEVLAEKYEYVKNKQEELTTRCKKVLIRITQMHSRPREAEKFLYKEVKNAEEIFNCNKKVIDQIKSKKIYQEIQMQNWMKQVKKQDICIETNQLKLFQEILKETSETITAMMNELNIYKDKLGLK